jgi:hypothetical protein
MKAYEYDWWWKRFGYDTGIVQALLWVIKGQRIRLAAEIKARRAAERKIERLHKTSAETLAGRWVIETDTMMSYLRKCLAAVLTATPLEDGRYVHLPYCNGDPRKPAGTPGVSCCCMKGR